jgi:hypothetical protein
MQVAAFEKHHHPDSWAIVDGVAFDIENQTLTG